MPPETYRERIADSRHPQGVRQPLVQHWLEHRSISLTARAFGCILSVGNCRSNRRRNPRPGARGRGVAAEERKKTSAPGSGVLLFAGKLGHYKADRPGEARYSRPRIKEAVPVPIIGNPDPSLISTSFVERQNLTVGMQVRRLTRLTNAFSKKLCNLRAALALHFAHYNFVRVHQTLDVAPAVAAGLESYAWSLKELLDSSLRLGGAVS